MKNSQISNRHRVMVIDQLSGELEYIAKENENLTLIIVIAHGLDQQGNIKIIINGKKANVQILGFIIGSLKQRIKLNTLQDHLQGESRSHLYIKSVLFDEAQFIYQGMINIRKNAQKSNAYQKNQNLLLSKNAKITASPILEINTNDVYCTHGCTSSRIDQNQVSYLSSRGLDKKNATELITKSFFHDILAEIKDKKIKNDTNQILNKKLNDIFTNIYFPKHL